MLKEGHDVDKQHLRQGLLRTIILDGAVCQAEPTNDDDNFIANFSDN